MVGRKIVIFPIIVLRVGRRIRSGCEIRINEHRRDNPVQRQAFVVVYVSGLSRHIKEAHAIMDFGRRSPFHEALQVSEQKIASTRYAQVLSFIYFRSGWMVKLASTATAPVPSWLTQDASGLYRPTQV
jgi:hypothetical protein